MNILVIAEVSVPRLRSGVKLQFDRRRDRWVVQAPERLFVPDEIALEILKRCDGQASVRVIVDDLAQSFQAPRTEILGDVLELLKDLAEKGVIAS